MGDDAEALSEVAAAVFPLGDRPGADPLDLAHYIATELTAECFRTLIRNPNTMLFVAELAHHIMRLRAGDPVKSVPASRGWYRRAHLQQPTPVHSPRIQEEAHLTRLSI
jgi:hypothetical protein